MRRRELITLLAGVAAAWPLMAHAQQDGRVRRVGMLSGVIESDDLYQAWFRAFRQGLQQLGWIEGRNLRLDLVLNSAGDLVRMRRKAQELVSLGPDVIVVSGAAGTRALQELTRSIPIVFVQVGDPVASGVVGSIAHPGGNTTGITNLFPSIAGKWLELLKEAAPHLTRVALLFNPELPVTETYLVEIEAAARALAVKATRAPVRSSAEVERVIGSFGTEPNGGAIVVPPPPSDANRDLLLRLATQHRLPTMSSDRFFVVAGDLMSYGTDILDLYRRAASYVDRILRGEKPSDLPVQFPTKFELVINLKTAAAIGLTIPESLLFRADEVIK
jgi:putative tryptophan/tyrosine transport system substrate-binding protein